MKLTLSALGGMLAMLPAVLAATVDKRGPVPYKVQTPPLDTDWTYKVGTNPWPEHPRPLLHRDNWQSLNGIWTYESADGSSPAQALASPPDRQLGKEIMIPSCVESGLSGVQEYPVTNMWFTRTFKVPDSWRGQNVLLNFEAVDYEATVFLNGVKVGHNVGGYFRFTIDVTSQIKHGQDNTLSCSGIWQTVWLESVPQNHITGVDVTADMDGNVAFTVHSSGNNGTGVKFNLFDKHGKQVALSVGRSDSEVKFRLASPNLWSPSSPYLYNITVSMGADTISSYTAFRSIAVGEVNGIKRPLLNGKFTFLMGTLDQGFWPDGLYLPPNREAMVYDLKMLKSLGFNSIKVEPDLFFRACDEMGLVVIQDMPSMSADGRVPNADQQAEFRRQLGILINEHKNYPSILVWVIYNEGWAQINRPPYPEGELTEMVRKLDPTRLIDSVTGWNDHGFGDFSDNHHYANPQCGSPFSSLPGGPYDSSRIGFSGEFGGVGHNVSADHLWKVQHAIDEINQTYEMDETLEAYNYRTGVLFRELKEQIEMYACSGAIYTQTSDVEGELNGLYTYDRRILRPDVKQWKRDIGRLYAAAQGRGGA
ncbi:hydrolase, putative [Cordyceps militaris CM01]|uniref:Hydrolase, putative n=1 Tax=Cordyceps militaris (strain CM01) TaxID=983644 RepID=G3JFK9_CORMM|nr:hydrolase, putative [Cordyceps militaris CM01]EGX93583.1 hydrolase, putative [Cordyceps militaris CM01]